MLKGLLKRLREWWDPPLQLAEHKDLKPAVPRRPFEPSVPGVDRDKAENEPLTTSEPGIAHNSSDSNWKDGHALQPPGSDGGRALTVRIGLDFGTAFTKVAIRVADTVLPVQWVGAIGADGHFLPGVLSRLSDDSVRLGSLPEATQQYKRLKAPFLPGATATHEDRARAVAFVALVLRYCRAFLFQTHDTLIRNRRLVWVLNIGCPTNIYDAERLTEEYRTMFLVAWKVSQSPASIRIPDIATVLRGAALSPSEIGLDSIEAVPEFVAQVAVYARSPQRQDGLHLLVDCGSGTLDIATFNVARQHGSNEDIYAILHSEVVSLGTHFLMQEFSRLRPGAAWPDIEPVPTRDELRNRFGLKDNDIHRTMNRFGERVSEAVTRVLRLTKQSRNPLAQAWFSGLPIFLSGGGCSCPIYDSAVNRACRGIAVRTSRSRFPLPEGVIRQHLNLSESEFHRLSVAFGLTYDPEIIGKIYRTSETPNLTLHQRRRPDRDELYSN